MNKIRLLIIISITSFSAHAEAWKIGQYLNVFPPGNIDVTFQIHKDYDSNEKLLMGWNDNELSYVLTVDQQPGGLSSKRYWDGIEAEMKKDPSFKKLNVNMKEMIKTNSNNILEKKIYVSAERNYYLILYLIKNQKIAYYVILQPFDNTSIKRISSEVDLILKTAIITK